MILVECSLFFMALSDTQRLRIVNSLCVGPLCVCHFEEIVEAEQVRVSKQLRYLKEQGIVRSERVAQWMVYSLVEPENEVLNATLTALQTDSDMADVLRGDRKRRDAIVERISDSKCDPLEFIATQSALAGCEDAC